MKPETFTVIGKSAGMKSNAIICELHEKALYYNFKSTSEQLLDIILTKME